MPAKLMRDWIDFQTVEAIADTISARLQDRPNGLGEGLASMCTCLVNVTKNIRRDDGSVPTPEEQKAILAGILEFTSDLFFNGYLVPPREGEQMNREKMN